MTDCKPTPMANIEAAAEWRLMALLLERPRAGWNEQVAKLAAEVRDPEIRSAALAVLPDEGVYLALMGPGGVASPREAAHQKFQDPGWILADLNRHYEAFAFRPRAEDPADHIAVEADFIGFLHLKEAFAVERGHHQAAELTRQVRQRFAEFHLAPLAAPLAERLAAAPGHLGLVLRCVAERLPEPPAQPNARPVIDPDGDCLTCAAS